jgi:hypothetical protein
MLSLVSANDLQTAQSLGLDGLKIKDIICDNNMCIFTWNNQEFIFENKMQKGIYDSKNKKINFINTTYTKTGAEIKAKELIKDEVAKKVIIENVKTKGTILSEDKTILMQLTELSNRIVTIIADVFKPKKEVTLDAIRT